VEFDKKRRFVISNILPEVPDTADERFPLIPLDDYFYEILEEEVSP
jgi:hypothetical protein